MVASIPRHDYPVVGMADGIAVLDETASWVLERLEQSDIARSQALNAMLTLAKSRCARDPQVTKFATWEAWVTAMQVGSALFAAATTTEDGVSCRIREETMNLPATGPQTHVNAGTWITSFHLAVICREKERLAELAQVPVSFLRESGAVFDEYIYAWVETLQSFWFSREDTWDKLVTAVDGTSPEATQYADSELMLKILYPPIILFYRYLSRDAGQFGEALTDALKWHKEYWSADEDRSTNSDGLVALGTLAIACLARDAGMPIEVESEYLPKELLEFGWVGEIDT